jgi:ubiquinone/menaquinone biosynthesis C-methylase UbiE
MLEQARRRCPGAELVVGDLAALPWPARSFDGVLARRPRV